MYNNCCCYLASYCVCHTAVGGACVLAVSDWLSVNLVACQEWGLLIGSFLLKERVKHSWISGPPLMENGNGLL